jgi:hypothetical protein
MSINRLIVTAVAATMLAVPAYAGAAGPPSDPDRGHKPATTPAPASSQDTSDRPSPPGPAASVKSKAKAYGKHCQDQSKKHVKGKRGTPFSQCVTAMAKARTGKVESPRVACKDMSRKRAEGEKRTPFSKCVVAAAKLLREQSAGDDGDQATA